MIIVWKYKARPCGRLPAIYFNTGLDNTGYVMAARSRSLAYESIAQHFGEEVALLRILCYRRKKFTTAINSDVYRSPMYA